jgi:hypothetical protein
MNIFKRAWTWIKSMFSAPLNFYVPCGLIKPYFQLPDKPPQIIPTTIDELSPGASIVFRHPGAALNAAIEEGEEIAQGGGEAWATHACVYKGAGKYLHSTIEAEWPTVTEDCLENSLGPNHQFIVFNNYRMTQKQRAGVLAYAQKTVGLRYDIKGDLSFILPCLHPDPKGEWCSEDTAEAEISEGYSISDNPANKTSPNDILRWMVKEGETQGWYAQAWYNVDYAALRTAVLAGKV